MGALAALSTTLLRLLLKSTLHCDDRSRHCQTDIGAANFALLLFLGMKELWLGLFLLDQDSRAGQLGDLIVGQSEHRA
jgi:hypothetical protein